MPGSFIFKPIQAELREDKGLVHKMDPYCKFTIGNHHAKSRACKEGGRHPHWDDAVVVEKSEDFAKLEIKDDNLLNPNRKVGEIEIDLQQVEKEGYLNKWFPILYGDQVDGRILLEITYTSQGIKTQDVPLTDAKPKGEILEDF